MDERKKVQVWIYRKIGGKREVLLLFTRPGRGEFWQPVTGSVEPGEELSAAALREASEETGLNFSGMPHFLEYSFSFESHGCRFTEFCYEIEATEPWDVRIDPKEHTAFRWSDPWKALGELKHPSNAEALRLLLTRWEQAT